MNGRRPGGSGSGQGPLIALEEGCRRGGRAGSRLRGGMAAGNVGVIHPFSAGLGVVLHVAHGLGNCLALNVLGDIYPKEYKQFRTMIERQGVNLPTGICKDLTEEQYEGLYRGCIVHEKPLTNALGPDFKQILTRENLIERYKSI